LPLGRLQGAPQLDFHVTYMLEARLSGHTHNTRSHTAQDPKRWAVQAAIR